MGTPAVGNRAAFGGFGVTRPPGPAPAWFYSPGQYGVKHSHPWWRRPAGLGSWAAKADRELDSVRGFRLNAWNVPMREMV
jgi:hypothetical protein